MRLLTFFEKYPEFMGIFEWDLKGDGKIYSWFNWEKFKAIFHKCFIKKEGCSNDLIRFNTLAEFGEILDKYYIRRVDINSECTEKKDKEW